VFRTRISRPPDRTDYGASLWKHILRDQLVVTEAEFWECVRKGEPPQRGQPHDPAGEPIPVDLIALLIDRVGLTAAQVAAMTKEEAISRLNRYWETGQ